MRFPRRSKTIVFVMAPLTRHRRCAVILHGAVDGILANNGYPWENAEFYEKFNKRLEMVRGEISSPGSESR